MKTKYSAIIAGSCLLFVCANRVGAAVTLLPLRYEINGVYIHRGVTSQSIENAYGTNTLGLPFAGTSTYDFYSPPLTAAVSLTTGDKGAGTFFMQNSGPSSTDNFKVTGRMKYYDYNPATGGDTLILDTGASLVQNVNHGQTVNWDLDAVFLPADFTIPAGHLLHIAVTIALVSGTPGNWGQLLYNGPAGATTVARFPQRNSPPPPWPISSGSIAPPKIVSIGVNPDPSVQLQCSGAPGGTYLVQATTNLCDPASWVTICTNVTGTNGLSTFVDPATGNYPCRFYRTVAP